MIGLSGLITPSLEEMSQVAREMQRQDFHIPLLIGGATTSRAHTALKIEPHYKAGTVWVKDASRAVGVAQSLVSKDLVDDFLAKVRADYADVRERHRNRGPGKQLVSLEKARAQRFAATGPAYEPPQPNQPGITVFDAYDLADAAAVHRLDAVLPGVGTGRPLSGDPHRRRGRHPGQRAVQRRPGHAGPDRGRKMAHRARP